MKSQFRISKPETNYDSNSKFQFRNPKQCQNSSFQNLKLFNSLVLKIRNYVIRICFGFQISRFEFAFLLNLGVLCPVEYFHGRGVSVAPVTVFHGASHRLSDSSVLSRQACPEPFLCQDKLRRRDAKTHCLTSGVPTTYDFNQASILPSGGLS